MKNLTFRLLLFFSVLLPTFASTNFLPESDPKSKPDKDEESPTPSHRNVQDLIDINFPGGIPVQPLPMPRQAKVAGNKATNTNLTARDEAENVALSNVYQIITVLLSTELLGGVHNSTEIDLLCDNFKWNRYGDLGLNETMINEMLCDKDLEKVLPASAGEIKGIVQQWLSALWVQQTYGVMAGHYDKICDIIDEAGASTVDIDGKQMKGIFCRKKKDKRALDGR